MICIWNSKTIVKCQHTIIHIMKYKKDVLPIPVLPKVKHKHNLTKFLVSNFVTWKGDFDIETGTWVPFYKQGLTLIPFWISKSYPVKCGIK